LEAHSVERKLAAIFAADVEGYSRLMGRDEVGTLRTLTAYRVIIDRLIASHRGRIFNTAGDSLVADFGSAVDAAQCAVEVQKAIAKENADRPAGEQMRFRIGIHVGDIIVQGDDIYGDGVNIAARLEALSDPGGLCVSRMVRDQIRDKLAYPFEDRGEQSVKNIARPVRVYALRPEAVADLATSSVSPAPPISQPSSVPRLSIVVLPFANLSNDSEQQYFADGITEDLTADLSRIADSFVISRNTAFTYRNKPIGTKQIGRDLRVRYVLEGSVRRSGNQVRVNTQLIDAESDAHLWAGRFDGDTSDLFALQDEITSRIAVTLNLELVRVEAGRTTEHPDALDYILRGRAASNKPPSPEKYAEEISLFERALALDPRSVEAQSLLATALMARVVNNMTDTAAADIARAEGLARQALAASPLTPLAHFAKGQVLRAQRRYEEAIPEYETALASNRNWVGALHALGQCKLFAGAMEETIPLVEQAIRLSPRDPQLGIWYQEIGRVHLLQSRTDEAIVWHERARNAAPAQPYIRAWLASAYALKGETERAAVELAEARRLSGDDRFSSIARLKALGYFRALVETTFFAGLRKAGMPEE
jgi:adenylate cyclase